MGFNLKGYKNDYKNRLMGDCIIYKGRRMTERETRKLVNYSIEHGYKLLSEVPDEIAARICDIKNRHEEFKQYDDTPDFIALPEIERVIRKVSRYWCYDFDADSLIADIKEELGYEK